MDKVFMPHRGMRYLLPCLLGLALLAPATARAIDFKISGVWQILLEESNVTPRGVDGADSFGALQRFRIQLDAVASRSLRLRTVRARAYGMGAERDRRGSGR